MPNTQVPCNLNRLTLVPLQQRVYVSLVYCLFPKAMDNQPNYVYCLSMVGGGLEYTTYTKPSTLGWSVVVGLYKLVTQPFPKAMDKN